MKAILLSIKPEYVAKILNGEKTIEIRKKFPKNYVGWVYIYCTRSGKKLFDNKNGQLGKCVLVDDRFVLTKGNFVVLSKGKVFEPLNGTVVARFWCKNVEKIEWLESHYSNLDTGYCTDTLSNSQLLAKSRISEEGLQNYLYKNGFGYAIHISKLEIFDKPKELREFEIYCSPKKKCCKCKHVYKYVCGQIACDKPKLTKAPQNYCYVEI